MRDIASNFFKFCLRFFFLISSSRTWYELVEDATNSCVFPFFKARKIVARDYIDGENFPILCWLTKLAVYLPKAWFTIWNEQSVYFVSSLVYFYRGEKSHQIRAFCAPNRSTKCDMNILYKIIFNFNGIIYYTKLPFHSIRLLCATLPYNNCRCRNTCAFFRRIAIGKYFGRFFFLVDDGRPT